MSSLTREPSGATPTLVVRAPLAEDEAQVDAAEAELAADGFAFTFRRPGEEWSDYLARAERERTGIDLEPGRVPATMLFGVVDGEIVGRGASVALEPAGQRGPLVTLPDIMSIIGAGGRAPRRTPGWPRRPPRRRPRRREPGRTTGHP